MKRLTGLVMALVVMGWAGLVWGANPRGTSSLVLKGKTVSVEYGRPSLKGRTTDELLGRLKAGGVWRLGADTSTTFKTGTDLVFDGVAIPAGEYSLWMQRQEDNSWKLVFNKQHGQWGTQHNASLDFASAPMKETKLSKPVEMVTIKLAKAGPGGRITVQWGSMETTAAFRAK